MHKIYALLDFELNLKKGWSLEAFVRAALEKNAVYLQYRDKIQHHDAKVETIKALRRLWPHVLIANDDLELALYCDGVHLGQEDIARVSPLKSEALAKIRDKIGAKIVGLSTHDATEIAEANLLDIDYIGLGAYRMTQTKQVETLLGERLEALAKESLHPVAAIGGVRADDVILHVDFLVLGSALYEN